MNRPCSTHYIYIYTLSSCLTCRVCCAVSLWFFLRASSSANIKANNIFAFYARARITIASWCLLHTSGARNPCNTRMVYIYILYILFQRHWMLGLIKVNNEMQMRWRERLCVFVWYMYAACDDTTARHRAQYSI